MTIDKITIINWALTDLGVGAVYSVDDDSDLSVSIEHVWQRTTDECFAMHDWSFARRTTKLARLVDPPQNGWTWSFDLPGDKIGDPIKIMASISTPEPLRTFMIEGMRVHAHEPDLWAVCKCAVDPDHWDPAFRAAFTIALSGYLAVPIASDPNARDAKLQEAFGTPGQQGTGGRFGRLMAQNKASQPVGQPLLNQDPLSAARWGNGAYPWHGSF
jgi:hypothetical protein